MIRTLLFAGFACFWVCNPSHASESRAKLGKIKIPLTPGKDRSGISQSNSVRNKGQNNLVRRFIQTVNPSKQNYLAVLKNSSSYSANDLRWRPDFSYESPTHPGLSKLRVQYDLKTVAGNGSETSQIIRLMKWAHEIIPYDGSKSVPPKRNALDIISIAKKNKCGFDCRGIATILNEAYLALGYPSRLLTCLPKDTTDKEHHVITTVFSRSLNKWVWMDPANAAYVTDERGNLLDVREVRERLINDQKLTLNSDANLNGKPVTIKQYIYNYMVKNMYWFQTPLHNGFNSETPAANKHINYAALFPTDHTPYGLDDIRLGNGTAYMTTNADYFWQKPRMKGLPVPKLKKKRRSK